MGKRKNKRNKPHKIINAILDLQNRVIAHAQKREVSSGQSEPPEGVLEQSQQFPPQKHRLLESNKRLSESLIWQLQENFYEESGISAWDKIPYFPTSNAFIGEIYAKAIIAFLLDFKSRLNPGKPVYIIEIAAGTACFSFYILKELMEQKACFESLKNIKICYVITDFTENNLEFWKTREEFKPYLREGIVDFALLKPEFEDSLYLTHAKTWLTADKIKNPVIAIANYFFDSIRQDYFHISSGKLQEARMTFYQEIKDGIFENESDNLPIKLESLKKTETYVPVSTNYYEDPRLNRLLEFYCRQSTDQDSLMFPLGALRCLQNLQKLSNHNFMLFSSDKGCTNLALMPGLREVPFYPDEKDGFAYHDGAFSYMANYHVLSQYFRQEGGVAFNTDSEWSALDSMIGVFYTHPGIRFEHLNYFWTDTMKKRSVLLNHYHCRWLMQSIPEAKEDFDTVYHQCLAMLELSNADPIYFLSCASHIVNVFIHNQASELPRLIHLLERIEKNIYSSGFGKQNVLVWLREIYVYLGNREKWSTLNNKIAELYGKDTFTYHYWALFEEENQKFQAAEHLYKQALELMPSLDAAKRGLKRVQDKLLEHQTV